MEYKKATASRKAACFLFNQINWANSLLHNNALCCYSISFKMDCRYGQKIKIMDYYIFGAHSRGYTLYEYLRTLKPQNKIIGFLYNNDEANPSDIEGVKVVSLEDSNFMPDLTANVFIATRGEYHESIADYLLERGFTVITSVTPQFDTDLRNQYIRNLFEASGKEFHKIYEIKCPNSTDNMISSDAKIYIAKTASDAPFQKSVNTVHYEGIIQVGCALTENRLAEALLYDDCGDGISNLNTQFCELTALYWIWKNAMQDIVGLEHWRRRFILPDNWISVMKHQHIDVILPVPLCVMPSLEENYKSRHLGYIWDKMFEIMADIHPKDAIIAKRYCAENKIYSPCNMIIAKKTVFDEYCEWLFPILLKLNAEIGIIDDVYQNRYPGFISERLLTYYFDINRDRYNVFYADKSFLHF